MMSTTSQPESSTVLRHQKDGSRISVPCPTSIVDYNTFMGGSTEETKSGGTIAAEQNAENFTNTFFTFCLTWP